MRVRQVSPQLFAACLLCATTHTGSPPACARAIQTTRAPLDVVIRHVSDDSASMNLEPEFAAIKKRYKKYTHASAAAPRRGPLGKDGCAAAPQLAPWLEKRRRRCGLHGWFSFSTLAAGSYTCTDADTWQSQRSIPKCETHISKVAQEKGNRELRSIPQ